MEPKFAKGKPSAQVKENEQVTKSLEQVAKALTVAQEMLKHVFQRVGVLSSELSKLSNSIIDLQYREEALLKLLNVDPNKLNELVTEAKIQDWQKASEKDSQSRGLVTKECVTSNEDIVVWSSQSMDDANVGVFRSKVKIKEIGPAFEEAAMGKKAGDVFTVSLGNDVVHSVNLIEVLEEQK